MRIQVYMCVCVCVYFMYVFLHYVCVFTHVWMCVCTSMPVKIPISGILRNSGLNLGLIGSLNMTSKGLAPIQMCQRS